MGLAGNERITAAQVKREKAAQGRGDGKPVADVKPEVKVNVHADYEPELGDFSATIDPDDLKTVAADLDHMSA